MNILYPSSTWSHKNSLKSNVSLKKLWHWASITRKLCITSEQCNLKIGHPCLYYGIINLIAIPNDKVDGLGCRNCVSILGVIYVTTITALNIWWKNMPGGFIMIATYCTYGLISRCIIWTNYLEGFVVYGLMHDKNTSAIFYGVIYVTMHIDHTSGPNEKAMSW